MIEGPLDVEERIESMCASMSRFARCEPESVLCLTGPAGELDEGEARRLVVADCDESRLQPPTRACGSASSRSTSRSAKR